MGLTPRSLFVDGFILLKKTVQYWQNNVFVFPNYWLTRPLTASSKRWWVEVKVKRSSKVCIYSLTCQTEVKITSICPLKELAGW